MGISVLGGVKVPQGKFSVSTPAVAATDPNFSSVVLLMHMDGANGSTTFTDSSNSNHTITRAAPAAISTAQSIFGSSSVLLNDIGESGGHLEAADSDDWNIIDNDFTLEVYARQTAFEDNGGTILGQWFAGSAPSWVLVRNEDLVRFLLSSTSGFDNFMNFSSTISVNVWEQITIVRKNDNWAMWLDGTRVIQVTNTPKTIGNSTLALRIGENSTNNVSIQAYLDELRITKGVARFDPSSATITLQTEAFPDS